MKRSLGVAMLAMAIGGAAVTAQAQEQLPPWFERFAGDVRASLERLEELVAQNTADIARHEQALGNLGARAYDFRDYLGERRNQVRTYRLSGASAGPCTAETSVITRIPQHDGSVFVRADNTWRTAGGSPCVVYALEYLGTAEAFSITGFEMAGVRSTRDVGLPVLTSTMRLGSSWGGAARVTRTSLSTGEVVGTGFGATVGSLVGIEDVTVPAGTFTGCLKTSTIFNDSHINNTINMNWWCSGVGFVRSVLINTGNSVGYERELVSIE